jgi:hypothetical protein
MQKRKPHLVGRIGGDNTKKKRKQKQARDPRTPMERVMIMGPSGKLRLEWRRW